MSSHSSRQRSKMMSSRPKRNKSQLKPKYVALHFPEDDSSGIAPISKLIDYGTNFSSKTHKKVKVIWNTKVTEGLIIAFSDNKDTLEAAIKTYFGESDDEIAAQPPAKKTKTTLPQKTAKHIPKRKVIAKTTALVHNFVGNSSDSLYAITPAVQLALNEYSANKVKDNQQPVTITEDNQQSAVITRDNQPPSPITVRPFPGDKRFKKNVSSTVSVKPSNQTCEVNRTTPATVISIHSSTKPLNPTTALASPTSIVAVSVKPSIPDKPFKDAFDSVRPNQLGKPASVKTSHGMTDFASTASQTIQNADTLQNQFNISTKDFTELKQIVTANSQKLALIETMVQQMYDLMLSWHLISPAGVDPCPSTPVSNQTARLPIGAPYLPSTLELPTSLQGPLVDSPDASVPQGPVVSLPSTTVSLQEPVVSLPSTTVVSLPSTTVVSLPSTTVVSLPSTAVSLQGPVCLPSTTVSLQEPVVSTPRTTGSLQEPVVSSHMPTLPPASEVYTHTLLTSASSYSFNSLMTDIQPPPVTSDVSKTRSNRLVLPVVPDFSSTLQLSDFLDIDLCAPLSAHDTQNNTLKTVITDHKFHQMSLRTIQNAKPTDINLITNQEQPVAPLSVETGIPENVIKEARVKSNDSRRKFAVGLFRSICSFEEVYGNNVKGKVYQTGKSVSKGQINKDKITAIRHIVYQYFPCPPSEETSTWCAVVRAIDKANWLFHAYVKKHFDLSSIM